MPEEEYHGYRAFGAGGSSTSVQRHGQPTAGAGPAAGDPTKVMDTNLSRGMDSARVCKAQSLRKLAPAGRPSGSTGTNIARPSGTDASHRRPNHRAKHVHHCARGRLRQGRGHRLGDGRSPGFGLRPGTLRASPAPDRRARAWWASKAASWIEPRTKCRAAAPAFQRARRSTRAGARAMEWASVEAAASAASLPRRSSSLMPAVSA